MTQTIIDVLTALIFLSVKHTIADFFIQFRYQYENKGKYGHPGGLLHAGIHSILTLPVFLILAPSSLFAVMVVVIGEFVLHYHIDWIKMKVNRLFQLHPKTKGFWYVVGLDQFAHHLTYLAIIAVLLLL